MMPPLHSIMQLGNKSRKTKAATTGSNTAKGAKRKRVSLGKPQAISSPMKKSKRVKHRT